MLYLCFKYLHVFLAITAVGFNISYAVWIRRATNSPDHLDFALRGIKFMDDRIANPCYIGLAITGIGLAQLGRLPLTTPWIVGALGLLLLALGMAYGGYTPSLTRQIRILSERGATSEEYRRQARRSTQWGISLAVVVVLILVLMIFKSSIL